jgi:L-iditol 2-dehydrogenase
MNKMKAAKVISPMAIELAEVPIPIPSEDEVLIRVKYAGICGTDLKIYDGSISYAKEGLLSYPTIPGHEWSGEVVEVGSKVTKIKVGDRVTGECHIGCGTCDFCLNGKTNICPDRIRVGIIKKAGAFAEYVTITERAVHILPPPVSYEEGALVEPLTIALHALDKLENISGSSVLVFGLGPIGLLVSQLARTMGATMIIGVDTNPERLSDGVEAGCDYVTSLTEGALKQYVLDTTEGRGVNIVVEAAGVSALFSLSIELVSPGGQISLLGLSHGKAEITVTQIIAKDLKIFGNMASARVWERAINLIATKRINLEALKQTILPFENCKKAMDMAYGKENKPTKVLIEF